MDSKECITCNHHRKALCDEEGKEKVACAYWSSKNISNGTILLKNGLEIAWYGWANLTCRPETEGRGIFDNGCVIVNKNDCCNEYKKIS